MQLFNKGAKLHQFILVHKEKKNNEFSNSNDLTRDLITQSITYNFLCHVFGPPFAYYPRKLVTTKYGIIFAHCIIS
jgi:hypothetical protein